MHLLCFIFDTVTHAQLTNRIKIDNRPQTDIAWHAMARDKNQKFKRKSAFLTNLRHFH